MSNFVYYGPFKRKYFQLEKSRPCKGFSLGYWCSIYVSFINGRQFAIILKVRRAILPMGRLC